MAVQFSYNRKEKLKSRKQLESLFAGGKSFLVFPVKVFYMQQEHKGESRINAGVGVSARNFKKAVHRNRIKRLLREHYRLNKQDLHTFMETQAYGVAVFFLYIGRELPEKDLLGQKMPQVLNRLIKELGNEKHP